ncbi:hypothetical protein KIN20_035124 [Parelaphostrongylus tenuis]|uniref:Uncharacterized protein n=1 Tax=Parelaphostrongylus tenuis TaxID=148309 RepID=A0AAD5RB44_PARTN|nr:hypothetical protein KIN20_035124 [Parelaphostrongylus tenuis]
MLHLSDFEESTSNTHKSIRSLSELEINLWKITLGQLFGERRGTSADQIASKRFDQGDTDCQSQPHPHMPVTFDEDALRHELEMNPYVCSGWDLEQTLEYSHCSITFIEMKWATPK